ncbi:MAG: PAS domain S-box protein [Chitinophagaceae bacterium]
MSDGTISAFEMFALFEMTPDLVCIAGKDGFLKNVNPAVISKLGYTRAELFSHPIANFIHPDDRDQTHRERQQMLQGSPMLNFQNRYIAKDGSIVWLEWTSVYSVDKELVFAIAKDITLRKEIEKDIEDKYRKFKSLATHFKTSIEKDRKYLAVELHEELAQLAAVVKLDVDWVNTHENDLSPVSKKRIEHALAVSDLLMTTIRRISFSISPTMLDDIGLNETLQWHCNEFAILNGIPCLFESKYNEADLVQEMQLDFFRICQESLNNVMDHAQASLVKISIVEDDGKIYLSIDDDGTGFDDAQHKQTPGLSNMRELAASINASFSVQTAPGLGTKIQLAIVK